MNYALEQQTLFNPSLTLCCWYCTVSVSHACVLLHVATTPWKNLHMHISSASVACRVFVTYSHQHSHTNRMWLGQSSYLISHPWNTTVHPSCCISSFYAFLCLRLALSAVTLYFCYLILSSSTPFALHMQRIIHCMALAQIMHVHLCYLSACLWAPDGESPHYKRNAQEIRVGNEKWT